MSGNRVNGVRRSAFGAVLLAGLACVMALAGCVSGPATAAPGVKGAGGVEFEKHIHGGMHVVAETPGNCPVCNVYELRRDTVVRIRTEGGLGTGVVIDDEGTVLTNAHVVGEAQQVVVETYHGTAVRGIVTKTAKEIDLAVVKTTSRDVKWSAIRPSEKRAPAVGSTVYVIGHPAGLGWTLTTGIISAQRQMGEVQRTEILQITAAVSPGNSGGPAFDADGNWIGTVSSKLVGPGLENISFVIPARELRGFLTEK